jgi:hypothetical protein
MDIAAIGMASSLGADAVTACAAARAGLVRPREITGRFVFDPTTVEMVPFVAHPAAPLTDGFTGTARLAVLGAAGLLDLARGANLAPEAVAELGLVLALPSGYFYDAAEEREGLDEGAELPPAFEESGRTAVLKDKLQRQFVSLICQLAGLPEPKHHELVFEDHAGGARAIERAGELLQEGRVERCIVGGVDSYCDGPVVDALETLQLLKLPDNPMGLPAGEASAFLLLDRSKTAGRSRPAASLEMTRFVAGAAHHLAPEVHACRALSQLFEEVTRDLQDGSCRLMIGTHNGTHVVANEWGRALVSLPRALAEGDHWFPAISFGDTGAASLFVGACMALRGLARGYAPSDRILLWGSSPCGAKGALRIARI